MYKIENLFLSYSCFSLDDHIAVVLSHIEDFFDHGFSRIAHVYEIVYLARGVLGSFFSFDLGKVLFQVGSVHQFIQHEKLRQKPIYQRNGKRVCFLFVSVQCAVVNFLAKAVRNQKTFGIIVAHTGIAYHSVIFNYTVCQSLCPLYALQVYDYIGQLSVLSCKQNLGSFHRRAQINEIYPCSQFPKSFFQRFLFIYMRITAVHDQDVIHASHVAVAGNFGIKHGFYRICSYYQRL